ncbi:MAG: hypothetical protein R3A79_20105 [Nannocystaceae bacterium]
MAPRTPALPRALARSALALSFAAAACSDRPILDTYESDDGTATLPATTEATTAGPTTDPTSGPTTAGPTTSDPTSTSGPSTVTATSPTTDPSTFSTSSPTTSASSDDTGSACGDGWCDASEACDSCPIDCPCPLPDGVFYGCGDPPGAEVYGATDFGLFEGTRAYFAWDGFPESQWSSLTLHIFDASVDIDAAKSDGPWSGEHYSLRLYTGWSYNTTGWLNADSLVVEVYADNEWGTYEAFLEIYDRSGNWDAVDPSDPPLLYGYIAPSRDFEAPQGPFTAVFCDAFVSQIIPE